MGEDLLSPEALADWLGVPLATVYAWNHKATGPRYVRIGRHVRYRASDVEAWFSERGATTRRAS